MKTTRTEDNNGSSLNAEENHTSNAKPTTPVPPSHSTQYQEHEEESVATPTVASNSNAGDYTKKVPRRRGGQGFPSTSTPDFDIGFTLDPMVAQNPERVSDVLRVRANAFRGCAELHSNQIEKDEETVVFSVSITSSGKPLQIKQLGGTLAASQLVNCFHGALARGHYGNGPALPDMQVKIRVRKNNKR